MSKRTSGLGRGLGDLLADNSPEVRGGATVVRRGEDGEAVITPDLSDGVEIAAKTEIYTSYGQNTEKIEQISIDTVEVSGDGSEAPVSSDEVIRVAPQDTSVDMSVSGQTSGEVRPPHRSLKALFKSYK